MASKKPAGAKAKELEGQIAQDWQSSKNILLNIAADFENGIVDKSKLVSLQKIDMSKVLNALHIPDDAGGYQAGLKAILMRIPDGWGRWISCSKGWYPIIIDLNQKITQLYPDYEVYQVKEKFGGLRYYCAGSGEKRARKLIAAAEKLASGTCEDCGALGMLRDKGWLRTLCESCAIQGGYLTADIN